MKTPNPPSPDNWNIIIPDNPETQPRESGFYLAVSHFKSTQFEQKHGRVIDSTGACILKYNAVRKMWETGWPHSGQTVEILAWRHLPEIPEELKNMAFRPTNTQSYKRKRELEECDPTKISPSTRRLINYWNKCHNTQLLCSNFREGQVQDRLKQFSFQELKTAIKNHSTHWFTLQENMQEDWGDVFLMDALAKAWLNNLGGRPPVKKPAEVNNAG